MDMNKDMHSAEQRFSLFNRDFLEERVTHWQSELENAELIRDEKHKETCMRQLGIWSSALAFNESIPTMEPEYLETPATIKKETIDKMDKYIGLDEKSERLHTKTNKEAQEIIDKAWIQAYEQYKNPRASERPPTES